MEKLTINKIATHHKSIGGTFFSEGFMARRGDAVDEFKIIFHGERVFLYATRRVVRRFSTRKFTFVEYEPDTGEIRSVSPGGIIFKTGTMIKEYIRLLPLSLHKPICKRIIGEKKAKPTTK